MMRCVRGFIKVRAGAGAKKAEKVFADNVAKHGHLLSSVISSRHVGDNVYAIVANVDVVEGPPAKN